MAPARRAIFHNGRLKLSALGLAIFLWALVQTEPRNQETFSAVPVRVEVADTAWTVSAPTSPATVELRLGGPAREIIRLARSGTAIRIPIEAVGSRDTTVTLRREWVDLGQGTRLTVESLSPANVQISLERALTRVLPISMRLQGMVRRPLALASRVGLNPAVVRVRGPESRLVGLDSIPLEPFDLSSVTQSGIFTVAVDTAGLVGARVVPSSATLGVRVEDRVERVLHGLTVQAAPESGVDDVVIDPAVIEVRLSGARTLVAAVDPSFLRVWIAPELLRGLAPGEERMVPLQVEGVPDLVEAALVTEMALARRPARPSGGEEGRLER
jgi:YbbR-like protein